MRAIRLLPIPLAVLFLMPLSGCTWLARVFGDTPGQAEKTTIVEVFRDACATYSAALRLAAQANNANLLTKAQVASVSKAREAAEPVCAGSRPTNLTSAIIVVTQAGASIVLAASKE